jgi:hypothetical protein
MDDCQKKATPPLESLRIFTRRRPRETLLGQEARPGQAHHSTCITSRRRQVLRSDPRFPAPQTTLSDGLLVVESKVGTKRGPPVSRLRSEVFRRTMSHIQI